LLHTATLVHDDVVDDSYLRRGVFSINALWKNKIAVLVGDYLLSKGLLLSLENKEYNLLQIVSRAVKEMSEGELLQIEKARKLDIDEKVYFDIIQKKTASLIASCCSCGAASAGCDDREIEKMRLLGENIGIAFQIKDDLFDYEKSNQSGKPVGLDIKERKLTLPIIYSLKYGDSSEKRELRKIIKNKKATNKQLSNLLEIVNESGGIEMAKAKMNEFQNNAFEILSQFEENVYQKSLFNLVRFTTERVK
ncbi:MAG: polyprenyl synthetase family protein, partial [Bacteroidia bacterium]|nr:polyprenyl synthetase family protein [Bacteroidia bacterium]